MEYSKYEIRKCREVDKEEGLKKGFLLENSIRDERKKCCNKVEIMLDSSGDESINRKIEEFEDEFYNS